MAPGAKKKAKAKAKAKTKSAGGGGKMLADKGGLVTPGSTGLEAPGAKQPKVKDPELEAIDMKRKVVLMGGRWRTKLSELDSEVSVALEQSAGFPECEEPPGLVGLSCFLGIQVH